MPETDPMYLRTNLFAASFFLVTAVYPSAASSHPLKLSASLIEYEPEKKTLRVECKVFIDDFERSLSRSVLKDTDVSSLKKEQKPQIIEAYFKKFYSITFNGKRLPLKYESAKPLFRQNVLIIAFKRTALSIKKGDQLRIENSMFIQDFGINQSNRIAVRIPPFKINDGHVAKLGKSTFSYTFGESKQ